MHRKGLGLAIRYDTLRSCQEIYMTVSLTFPLLAMPDQRVRFGTTLIEAD
jgi:hypothetical protein